MSLYSIIIQYSRVQLDLLVKTGQIANFAKFSTCK